MSFFNLESKSILKKKYIYIYIYVMRRILTFRTIRVDKYYPNFWGLSCWSTTSSHRSSSLQALRFPKVIFIYINYLSNEFYFCIIVGRYLFYFYIDSENYVQVVVGDSRYFHGSLRRLRNESQWWLIEYLRGVSCIL